MNEPNRISTGPLCIVTRPYPVFREPGAEILPCDKKRCEKIDGATLRPRTRICANAACEREFHASCPGMIFCCRECFEATKSEAAWLAATPIPPVTGEPVKVKKETTPEEMAKRSRQNHECYEMRKATGKQEIAYERQKARRARERALKQEAEAEGGHGRNHPFVRSQAGRNTTRPGP